MLDGTGGESLRTLGRGRIVGDRVKLNFPYLEGESAIGSITTVRDRCRLLIEMGPKDQAWTFSDWYFERTKTR